MPVVSALTGIIALWATWYFYKDAWDDPAFPWYRWIQPAFMAFGGILCFVAAALLMMRKDSGRDVLRVAIGVIPVILALRLVIVAILFAGKIFDGTIVDRPGEISLVKIAVNIAVVAAIIWFVQQGKSSASKKAPGENVWRRTDKAVRQSHPGGRRRCGY